MVGDRGEQASMKLASSAGEDGLFVVEPVNDKREIIEGHGGAKGDVSDGVDRSDDVESEMSLVFARETVAPQTTDVVLAVGEEHVGYATSVSE